jgi:hypothetical protein
MLYNLSLSSSDLYPLTFILYPTASIIQNQPINYELSALSYEL